MTGGQTCARPMSRVTSISDPTNEKNPPSRASNESEPLHSSERSRSKWPSTALANSWRSPSFLRPSLKSVFCPTSAAPIRSTLFPPRRSSDLDPACRIADILLLTQTQRFDLLAVPSEIMDERRNSLTNLPIADVRIKDTSAMDMDGSASSSLPITIFFTSNMDMVSFKQHVGKTALLFMCLQGHMGDGASQLQVKTIKDLFWWQVGVGPRAEEMTAQAQQICGMRTADVQKIGRAHV